MAKIIRCHHCELQVAVDCTHCQHTLDRKGVQMPCCVKKLAAQQYFLGSFPKERHYCLQCCQMDPKYVVMWQTRFELLQKPEPCSECAVTLIRGRLRPPVPTVQTDELPIPFPAHSNTTMVGSCLPLQSSLLTGQAPRRLGFMLMMLYGWCKSRRRYLHCWWISRRT